MTREEFIADLADARRRRGWTQAYVAELVGVVQQTISMWERGRCRPDRRYLAAWALAMGADPYPETVDPVRAECGSYSGYQKHRRRGELPCDSCRDANSIYLQVYRAARRGRVVTR